jgi:thioredoxin reductase (NADPH)
MSVDTIYQLVIVGGGPGGLTAGLYASRARISTVLVEKGVEGGQILVTDWIDNYPGFPEGISGFDLAEKMKAQAQRFGLTVMNNLVASMDLEGDVKTITFEDGRKIQTRAVIIATGARPNKLNVPGEEKLIGKGVSYCATCDGPFYRDLDIAVVGGGDTAVEEAVYLTKFAKRVTIIHRRDELRASPIVQEEAFANKQITFQCDSEVIGIVGEKEVEALELRHSDGTEDISPFAGVFILIGTTPNNEMLPRGQLAMESGFIITDCMMQTNIPGVMAIGDIRHNSVRQVISAAGDGAVAEKAVEQYLDRLRQSNVLEVEGRKCSG